VSALYRIVSEEEWRTARREGEFRGSAHDVRDGFIHLSAPHQVAGTLAAHYPEKPGLVLLSLDAERLSAEANGALKWEASRDGALFPHLYGVLPLSVVTRATPLALDADGQHVLPSF
jgi:uncharacterized protein (DUF952 family)